MGDAAVALGRSIRPRPPQSRLAHLEAGGGRGASRVAVVGHRGSGIVLKIFYREDAKTVLTKWPSEEATGGLPGVLTTEDTEAVMEGTEAIPRLRHNAV